MAVEHRPSSTREKLLEASRAELAPHKSMEAVAEASGRVVGAFSVAAALVSGLGLVSATALTDAGWGWAVPTIVLSAISMALAVWATVPARATVSPGDLEDVADFFAGEIKRRGCLVRSAAVLFGFAMLLTPLPAVRAAWSSPDATLDVTATRRSNDLVLSVEAEHLPRNAIVTMVAASGARLLTGGSDGQGRLSAGAEVPMTVAAGQVRVVARAGRRVVVDRTVAVPSP
jgi:hypothetical protein